MGKLNIKKAKEIEESFNSLYNDYAYNFLLFDNDLVSCSIFGNLHQLELTNEIIGNDISKHISIQFEDDMIHIFNIGNNYIKNIKIYNDSNGKRIEFYNCKVKSLKKHFLEKEGVCYYDLNGNFLESNISTTISYDEPKNSSEYDNTIRSHTFRNKDGIFLTESYQYDLNDNEISREYFKIDSENKTNYIDSFKWEKISFDKFSYLRDEKNKIKRK